MSLSGKSGHRKSKLPCPLLEAFLPRQPIAVEAEIDPLRHFAIANYRTAKGLFDHLIRAAEQRQRDGKAERLGRLEIDD